jgi:hypothetical protein
MGRWRGETEHEEKCSILLMWREEPTTNYDVTDIVVGMTYNANVSAGAA